MLKLPVLKPLLVSLGVMLGMLILPAMAQVPTISAIEVQGAQRIEAETVRSYMQIGPGDPLEAQRIDRALKNLYGTGLFADVRIQVEGQRVIVQVVENPIINRIAFEGNEKIGDEILEGEVQLRPRVVYTQTRVQEDVRRILDIYRRSGRFAATVEPKVIPLDQNRVDLVFEISEGEKTVVRGIDFVGNKVFGDSTLRDEILTQESSWWRVFQVTDTYDPDRLTVDRELLRNFYESEGYADFRVLSAVAELSPDRDGFYITFTVEEGERYQLGEVKIESRIPNLDPETLYGQLTTASGDWYNADEVDRSIANLTTEIGTLGYAFVQIEPVIAKDPENRTLSLTYDIQEGPRVFVERIDIHGNTRTLDKVIRREFRLVEGDAFNATKVRRSRQRVQNLGFFSTVNVQTLEASAPDKVVLDVEVEEQSTGELTFGLGYSTNDGPLGDVSIRERNLLGRGQDLRADFSLSGKKSQANISFTEPYFLDRDLAAGFDVFRVQTNYDESSLSERNTGAALRLGYDLTEYLRHSLRYSLTYTEVPDVDSASPAVRQQEGKSFESLIGHDLLWDHRDSRFDTREGYMVRFSNDLAGLGGDIHYLRTRLTGGYWTPFFFEDVTLGVTGEAGYIFGLGEDVRITDAFLLGGNNLRGFKNSGAGPRDVTTDDVLGGNMLMTGSVELSFPLGLPEEYQIRGRVFSDIGMLFDTDYNEGNIRDEATPRASFGAGITWKSPFGPLAVDFAIPALKQDYDEVEAFRFNVGTRF